MSDLFICLLIFHVTWVWYIYTSFRVLKRGGRFLCLELSHVELPIFKQLWVTLYLQTWEQHFYNILCGTWLLIRNLCRKSDQPHVMSWSCVNSLRWQLHLWSQLIIGVTPAINYLLQLISENLYYPLQLWLLLIFSHSSYGRASIRWPTIIPILGWEYPPVP